MEAVTAPTAAPSSPGRSDWRSPAVVAPPAQAHAGFDPELVRTSAGAIAELGEVDIDLANDLLDRWRHYLGPCRRPFGRQAWCLQVEGQPVAVAVSASAVSSHIVGPGDERLSRRQLVELARLCSAEPWATRVMLRLWRELAARAWPYWRVDAAIAYSLNQRHEGRIYRFDGWARLTNRAGSAGGGTWSKRRSADDPARGAKSLWLWDLRPGTQPATRGQGS